MLKEIVLLILISMVPVFELRLSLPLGITKFTTPAWIVIPVCIIANIAIAPVIYCLLEGLIRILCGIEFINRLYTRYQDKVITRLRPKIEKYGIWGLAIFIGIPLPGSGVYSGAVGAHALGMSLKDYFLASIAGVCIAALVLTGVVYLGIESLEFFIHHTAV